MNQNKRQSSIERLNEFEKLTHQISEELKDLSEFKNKFITVTEKLNRLKKYYHNQWMDDVDNIQNIENKPYFLIEGQDIIWNVLSDHYEFVKTNIKLLADELNS